MTPRGTDWFTSRGKCSPSRPPAANDYETYTFTIELAQHEDRYVELLGERLQRAGRFLNLASSTGGISVAWLHKPKMIDNTFPPRSARGVECRPHPGARLVDCSPGIAQARVEKVPNMDHLGPHR